MDMSYTDTIDPALAVVLAVAEKQEHEQVKPDYPWNYVVFNCGVVAEITGITQDTYNDIVRLHAKDKPTVPMVDLGKGRKEENENDPDYIAKRDLWQSAQSWAVLFAVYAFGFRVEYIPDGMPGPDSDEWIEEFRLSGMTQTNSAKERLIAWVKYKVISRIPAESKQERTNILLIAGRIAGTVEVDVQDAVKRP